MIIAYPNKTTFNLEEITAVNNTLLEKAAWIDLFSPSQSEEITVEKYLGLNIPTRQEMHEIELSSRLYQDNGALFMTATMIANSESIDPKLEPVTFVLTSQQLITIRYIKPQSFTLFISKLKKINPADYDATALLLVLLDTIVERLADTLELVGRHLDQYSKTIFQPVTAAKLDYQRLMLQVGTNGDLTTKARESLITFNLLITFLEQTAKIDKAKQSKLATLSKDLNALSSHINFLSIKINFLLDATLGMISIEQNNIIKIFSVAAVIFLPPTLIASIYGMNFHFMPELSWKWGYLVTLAIMVFSSWLPYKYFKYRKWL